MNVPLDMPLEMFKKFEPLFPELVDACVEHLKKSDNDPTIGEYMISFINCQLRERGIEVSLIELDYICFHLALNVVKKIQRGMYE